jgi:ectoine hydroxylase-related dioxygenase (phytanoyl-CoA dioxygenase family)
VNKIGHALLRDDVFGKYTLSARMRGVAEAIDAKDPRVLQSMVICKQPKIGGEGGLKQRWGAGLTLVPCHNDSTFLYTSPPSAVGCWIALEECTPENGCLVSVRER